MMAIESTSTSLSLTQTEHLTTSLRRQIVAGHFAPGKRMPTFDQIGSQFNVSRSVVQHAVERLKQEGFVSSLPRSGLFVAPHPPHLKRYGIVFADSPGAPSWTRFDEALVKEASRIASDGVGRQFEIFAGTRDQDAAPEVRERLSAESRSSRFAGLILTPGTFNLADTAPVNDPDLPKVFLFGHRADARRPIVGVKGKHMVRRGLEWLRGRGRSRVAAIHRAQTLQHEDFDVAAPEGLVVPRQWRQRIGRSDPEVVRDLIPLLMDYPEGQRPDGLFIADDNLVEYVAAAIVDLGLKVGVDLDIVAHCNWPWAVPSVLPMQRIGYHAGDLLERCLKVIDAQRNNQPYDEVQWLPALFENEVH